MDVEIVPYQMKSGGLPLRQGSFYSNQDELKPGLCASSNFIAAMFYTNDS